MIPPGGSDVRLAGDAAPLELRDHQPHEPSVILYLTREEMVGYHSGKEKIILFIMKVKSLIMGVYTYCIPRRNFRGGIHLRVQ
jgi:hypothetical protein